MLFLFCLEVIRWCYNLVETLFCVGAFNNANNYNLIVVHSQPNHIRFIIGVQWMVNVGSCFCKNMHIYFDRP